MFNVKLHYVFYHTVTCFNGYCLTLRHFPSYFFSATHRTVNKPAAHYLNLNTFNTDVNLINEVIDQTLTVR